MKNKNAAYVKSKLENDTINKFVKEPSLEEQLEVFTDILIDIYIESKNEKQKFNQRS
ncbi:hypothetical protein [Ferruginibacter albus]|uniref:hypothetical protein n=1 Tax=Ferruginibacter albus TaxID=2875540 RepID=UPI001CC5BD49|nr:hypothetical protein [Ferruginibacter albus]UAY52828.1 hypothetical protein K9M53_03905 [Ferruginibacter albus]UAY53103.1 hypothetical protein K9M53_05345 [Ferruginibacter albus]